MAGLRKWKCVANLSEAAVREAVVVDHCHQQVAPGLAVHEGRVLRVQDEDEHHQQERAHELLGAVLGQLEAIGEGQVDRPSLPEEHLAEDAAERAPAQLGGEVGGDHGQVAPLALLGGVEGERDCGVDVGAADGSAEADDRVHDHGHEDHVEDVGVVRVALEGRQQHRAEAHEGQEHAGDELEHEGACLLVLQEPPRGRLPLLLHLIIIPPGTGRGLNE